jgi:DNA-binding transcriptional MerR regulator
MAEYTMSEVVEKTKLSKSTLVRWEERGIIPRPKRKVRTKARIYTDEIINKIIEYRDLVEEPPPKSVKSKTKKK